MNDKQIKAQFSKAVKEYISSSKTLSSKKIGRFSWLVFADGAKPAGVCTVSGIDKMRFLCIMDVKEGKVSVEGLLFARKVVV